MRKVFLILPVLLISIFGYSQSSDSRFYKKAKLYLNNHQILRVSNLNIERAEVNFRKTINNERGNIALSEIRLIKIPKGNHFLEGALVGTGTGALTALLIDLQPDPLGNSREKDAGFYLGFSAGGAALGAFIGYLFPKWKSVFSRGKLLGVNLPFHLDIASQTQSLNIKLTIAL